MALVAGPEGTEIHQRIISAAPDYLRNHGSLIMEMGIGQAEKLLHMVRTAGSYQPLKS